MFLSALVDWSRAQFALTAMFHWTFVPITLGLGIMLAIMETMYVRSGNEFWKRTEQFWMKLFGINFAIGVATGLILEFEFGTNWSNYSWFVGDIFGAPLAIEGMLAFFLETTFLAVMFFGWNRVSKRFHLTATWLTSVGASLSALWILVANAWMQSPVGMAFNPDTARNEMVDFWAILFSPVAINKFLHTVSSSFVLSSAFVIAVSSWFLLRNRNIELALKSIKLAAIFGLFGIAVTVWTGDGSAQQVARTQPMKLAAMEGLYEGQTQAPLVLAGVLNNDKKYDNEESPFLFRIAAPGFLSWLCFRDTEAFVPGVNDIINGYGHQLPVVQKMSRGRLSIDALDAYRQAKAGGDTAEMLAAKELLEANFAYFGYGYINEPKEIIPNIPLVFYSFHIMVMLGGYFILFFLLTLWWQYKGLLERRRWFLHLGVWGILFAYVASYSGWIVAEVGRQPWTIQDLLPVSAAISNVSVGAVQTTFIMFAVLFGVLLIAEVRIMLGQIKKHSDG